MFGVSFQENITQQQQQQIENVKRPENKENDEKEKSHFIVDLKPMLMSKSEKLENSRSHQVDFNVTLLLGASGMMATDFRSMRESISSSRASTYGASGSVLCHVEFDIFSGQKEPYKVDVGIYGASGFAKVYPERGESKIVPIWTESGTTWTVFVLRICGAVVTDNQARALSQHKIRLQLWEGRNHVAPKVRFDRPRPPNFNVISNSIAWLQHLVNKRIKRIDSASSNSKQNQKQLKKYPVSAKMNSTAATVPLGLYGKPKESARAEMEPYSQLESLVAPTANQSLSTRTSTTERARDRTFVIPGESVVASGINDTDNYLEVIVPMASLFIRGESKANNNNSSFSNNNSCIEKLHCKVSMEPQQSIISPEQVNDLCPLAIEIRGISGLPPTTAVASMKENKQNENDETQSCSTLQCSYQFGRLPPYQTTSVCVVEPEKVGTSYSLPINDTQIIMMGDIPPAIVRQQLLATCLVIHVTIGVWKGEARVDLSEIITRHPHIRILTASCPVLPREPSSGAMPPFLEWDTSLKVEVRLLTVEGLSCILQKVLSTNNIQDNCETALINRLILINRDLTCDLLREKVGNILVGHNFSTLCKNQKWEQEDEDSYLQQSDRRALLYSTKIDSNQHHMITGYFITDGVSMEMIITEADNSLLENIVYPEISSVLDQCKDYLERFRKDCFRLLYDSNCAAPVPFSGYPIFSMVPIMLSRPLTTFGSQPILYVREAAPALCVAGITKLIALFSAVSMATVLRSDLLPTAEMMSAVRETVCSEISAFQLPKRPKLVADISKTKESGNDAQYQEQKSQKSQTHSTNNRRQVSCSTTSLSTNKRHSNKSPMLNKRQQLYIEASNPTFSYSCQSRNAIESTVDQMRLLHLKKERRYTKSCCGSAGSQFLWSEVVDPAATNRNLEHESCKKQIKPRWKSAGIPNNNNNNNNNNNVNEVLHQISLPLSRQESWREGEQYSAQLKPTLPERDRSPEGIPRWISSSAENLSLHHLPVWRSGVSKLWEPSQPSPITASKTRKKLRYRQQFKTKLDNHLQNEKVWVLHMATTPTPDQRAFTSGPNPSLLLSQIPLESIPSKTESLQPINAIYISSQESPIYKRAHSHENKLLTSYSPFASPSIKEKFLREQSVTL